MVGQSLGAWLAGELERRGESRRAFARRIKVTDATVAGWIRSGARPTWENCQRIADALDVDVASVRHRAGYDHEPALDPELRRNLTTAQLDEVERFIQELRDAG
jgi:transcriptional regulator with XRE-family HTH domain